MTAELVITVTLAIAGLFVFLPMAKRYRSRKIVTCPETGQPAEILIDAAHAPALRRKKRSLTIRNCSLWPKRKGCTRNCLK